MLDVAFINSTTEALLVSHPTMKERISTQSLTSLTHLSYGIILAGCFEIRMGILTMQNVVASAVPPGPAQ